MDHLLETKKEYQKKTNRSLKMYLLKQARQSLLQHDITYDFKDLPRIIAFDKAFYDKTFEITKNS